MQDKNGLHLQQSRFSQRIHLPQVFQRILRDTLNKSSCDASLSFLDLFESTCPRLSSDRLREIASKISQSCLPFHQSRFIQRILRCRDTRKGDIDSCKYRKFSPECQAPPGWSNINGKARGGRPFGHTSGSGSHWDGSNFHPWHS